MYKEANSSAQSIRKNAWRIKSDSSALSGRALSCAANRQKQPVLHREANHHRTVRGVPYPSRPPLRREATLSGAKESWGVARGDRKPWCPVPFCPSPPGGGNTPPSVGENPPSPGLGTTLASCVCAAGTAESFALSLEGRKGTLSLEGKKKSTHFRECLNSGGVGGARTHDLSRVRRTL